MTRSGAEFSLRHSALNLRVSAVKGFLYRLQTNLNDAAMRHAERL